MTTNQAVQDPAQQLDDAIKNMDFSQLSSVGYDQIQELAKQYLQSTDPEKQELGQELQSVDPSIFELSPAQKAAKRVNEYLEKAGRSEEDIARFSTQLLTTAGQQTMSKIVGAMNDDTYREWETLNEYSPNVIQQLYLLNETSKMLLKKSYDDIYEEELQKAVDLSISILSSALEKAELISKLTKEQSKAVMTAFNANKYEIAVQLIYKFVNDNE